MSFKKLLGTWLVCALIVTAATAVSIRWLDIPIAQLYAHNINRLAPIGDRLGSSILISGELFLMAILITIRLSLGYLSDLGKAILISILASLTAFAANDAVLKVFFGLPNPGMFLFFGADHTFHFFHGNIESSFPSGHMALAAGAAIAIARVYSRFLLPLMGSILVPAAALIIGDWHFLSDVIAGIFIGATAGFIAGELWVQHSGRNTA
ncbi:MAG: phosphatase PAP2 family protein [Alphaproteobacteria bacterium]